MEITVTEPKKVGDGMNAYMAYRVNTKVSSLTFLGCSYINILVCSHEISNLWLMLTLGGIQTTADQGMFY